MKTCPYCEAEIANNAKKCKHCGETVAEEKEVRLCPYCESELSDTAKKCKFCGEWLDKKVEYKCNNCGYMIKKGDKTCSGCGGKLLREGIINSDRIHETKKHENIEKIKKDENGEEIDVPLSRRILSLLVDCFFVLFPIGIIGNLLGSIFIGQTMGTYVFGINFRNKDGGKINFLQKILNTLLYFPIPFVLGYWSVKLGTVVLLCIAFIRGIISFINSVSDNNLSITHNFGIVKKIKKTQGLEKAKSVFVSMLKLWLFCMFCLYFPKSLFLLYYRDLINIVGGTLLSIGGLGWLITTVLLNISKRKKS